VKTSDEILYSFLMVAGIVGSLAGLAWLVALLWTGTLLPPYGKGGPVGVIVMVILCICGPLAVIWSWPRVIEAEPDAGRPDNQGREGSGGTEG